MYRYLLQILTLMWRFSLRTLPLINRKLRCVLARFDGLSICCKVARFRIMMSSAFLQGNISPAIYQRPLPCVQSVMSHSPLQPRCEAHEDSGVRPERGLSCDAESSGEKWHSICFPSCYLGSHVWLTYPGQVTRDVFFSHSEWACLSSRSTRSAWLAERMVNSLI